MAAAGAQVVMVLKKEIMKTQSKELEKGAEYRQMLVQVRCVPQHAVLFRQDARVACSVFVRAASPRLLRCVSLPPEGLLKRGLSEPPAQLISRWPSPDTAASNPSWSWGCLLT